MRSGTGRRLSELLASAVDPSSADRVSSVYQLQRHLDSQRAVRVLCRALWDEETAVAATQALSLELPRVAAREIERRVDAALGVLADESAGAETRRRESEVAIAGLSALGRAGVRNVDLLLECFTQCGSRWVRGLAFQAATQCGARLSRDTLESGLAGDECFHAGMLLVAAEPSQVPRVVDVWIDAAARHGAQSALASMVFDAAESHSDLLEELLARWTDPAGMSWLVARGANVPLALAQTSVCQALSDPDERVRYDAVLALKTFLPAARKEITADALARCTEPVRQLLMLALREQ
jgi:hypothetical protein